MGVDITDDGGRLWIQRAAGLTRSRWLAERLWDQEVAAGRAPYLVVTAAWVFDAIVLSTVPFVGRGQLPILQEYAIWLMLPSWLFVTYLILGLHRRYEAIATDLIRRDPSSKRPDTGRATPRRYERVLGVLGVPEPPTHRRAALTQIVSTRVRVGLLVLGAAVYLGWIWIDPAPFAPLEPLYGETITRIKVLGIIPFVNYLLVVELVSMYVGVHLLLPLKLTSADLADVEDPRGYLGFRSVGRLLRDSTVAFLVLVTLYISIESVAPGTSPFDTFAILVLLGSSLFVGLIFFAPVYWLHVYMRGVKDDYVDWLQEELEAAGSDDSVFPHTNPAGRADYDEYTHKHIQLSRVENLREFPVETHLVVELVFVVMLPYVAHISSIFVFEHLLH